MDALPIRELKSHS